MTVKIGDRLPSASFALMTRDGPIAVSTDQILPGRRVVLFAVPGAFTPTCDSAHVPSFVRTADAIRAKGVDAIYCIAVNDAEVLRRWGETTGATDAGIVMLSDGKGDYSSALGLTFNNPAKGMYNRSVRYSMLVEDGVVTRFNPEPPGGVCEMSGGENMLSQL